MSKSVTNLKVSSQVRINPSKIFPGNINPRVLIKTKIAALKIAALRDSHMWLPLGICAGSVIAILSVALTVSMENHSLNLQMSAQAPVYSQLHNK